MRQKSILYYYAKLKHKTAQSGVFNRLSQREVIIIKTLSMLSEGESGTVENIEKESPLRKRLLDIGLVRGTNVKCLQKSVFGDPKAYLIRDTVIAIRTEDAKYIILN